MHPSSAGRPASCPALRQDFDHPGGQPPGPVPPERNGHTGPVHVPAPAVREVHPERSILSAADTQEDALSRDEDLHTEVAQLRRAMQTRPVIDQAIGVLMASFSLSPEDAWNVLVAVSQNTNTKLHQLARQLVTAVQGSALDEAVQQHLGAALLALRTPTSPARQPAEEGDGCEEGT